MFFLRYTVFLFLFSTGIAHTQNTGWDFIRDNDFARARPAFEAALQEHPHDEATLVGLIFLAETIRDHEQYEKYVNQLLDSGWQPEYVWLFQRLFTGTPDEALSRSAPGPQRLAVWALQQADTLFKYRHFAESAALRSSVIPDWSWAVCGPFPNISGSGFIEITAVENRAFHLSDSFATTLGVPVQWLKNTLRKPGALVDFSHLPQPDETATWYANTFIEVPTTRPVALRVTRSEPIKVWLDDQILLERPRPTASDEWDTETVFFDLPAGRHRLLAKIAPFPEDYTGSRIRLEFNDLDNNGDSSSEQEYDDSPEYTPRTNKMKNRFALRFTDPLTGQSYSDIQTSFDNSYPPKREAWTPGFIENPYLQTLQSRWQENPRDWWRLYLIAKAFSKYEAWEEGEAFFSNLRAEHPGWSYLRFLLAKFYDAEGKSERAEALLSEMDTIATPTYAEQFIRLSKINKEQEEPRYIAALETMLHLSPTNWNLLNRYLTFLKEKGRQEQIKTYVRRFLETHDTPKWKKRLEDYLEDESYKPSSYKQETDKEREKAYRTARQRLKTIFNLSDYGQVIRYLKQKDKVDDVLKTYDDILSTAPYLHFYRRQKAVYLFEKERLDEALNLVRKQLDILPYDPDLCELAGDILIEKKQDTEALNWYRRAEKLKSRNSYDLAGKIEKLENRRSYSGYFATINLEEVAKDSSWHTAFEGEEAIIPLFTQQIVYLPEEHKFQTTNKCIIQIRNEAGAKHWTEADLSLLGNITNARVIKKDGAVTSPDLGWGGMAVFKNLQPGDLILLEGAGERGMPEEFSDEMLDLEFLSWPAPVVHASFELLLPKDQKVFLAYNRLSDQHTVRDTGAYKLMHWEWDHIAKMETEEAIPENVDATAWIMYGDAPDWSRVVQWYQRKTYCRTEANYEVQAKTRALIQPGMSEQQVVEALHTYITKDINYSYVPFLNSNYIPKKPGATLSAKVGDCKDVASLMIAMLREQGIPAWYTLVSTHSFSNREPRPTPYVFNHAIVAYQTKDGILHFDDLTTDYFANGVLPDSDCDAWGLVIRDGETQIQRLPNHLLDTAITRVQIDADATLDTLGNILLDARVTRYGVAAGNWREILLRAAPEERLKKMAEFYGGGVLNHIDIESAHFENLDSINAPLHAQVRLKAYRQMDLVAQLYILPLPLPLSTATHKALFATSRYNDLDAMDFFELSPVRETVDLHFPPGFQLVEAPKPQTLESPFGRYSLRCEPIPGGLRIHRNVTFSIRFISNTDFQAFRQFYLDMLKADDGMVALRK